MTPIESARAWLAARTLTNNQANVLGTFTYCRDVVAELIAAAVEQERREIGDHLAAFKLAGRWREFDVADIVTVPRRPPQKREPEAFCEHTIDRCSCGRTLVHCRCMNRHRERVFQDACSGCRPHGCGR